MNSPRAPRAPRSLRSLAAFLGYRYRFLLLYTLYGALSLVLEVVVFRGVEALGIAYPVSNFLGVISGVAFAYWMNVRFNFKIPTAKRNRALMYFVLISAVSWGVQFLLRLQIQRLGWSYELSRFLIAGTFFLIAYWFHRRYSFVEYKQVGVAIYADGVEDIGAIYEKIGDYSDFIHIDIVDTTFRPDASDVKAYRSEVVKAYWRTKPIEVHIMSRVPSAWFDEITPHVDRVYVHTDIDEDHHDLFDRIRAAGCEPGIAISTQEDLNDALPLLDQVDHALLLAIADPGSSGQSFQMETLQRIRRLDDHPRRRHIELCVDGGVNKETIGLINAEHVVSGSYVLRGADPTRQIMILQTSSSYEPS